jgi:hypothetical protein
MTLNTFMFLFQVCLSFTERSSAPVSPPLLNQHTNELLLVPERDEQMALYALIARAAPDTTVPFLAQLFSERFARLNQVFLLAIMLLCYYSLMDSTVVNLWYFCSLIDFC